MEELQVAIIFFTLIIVIAIIFLIHIIKDSIRIKRREKMVQEYRKTERHVERLLNVFNQSIVVSQDSLEPLMDIILTNETSIDNISSNQLYDTFNDYLVTDNYEIKEEHILYKRKFNKGKALMELEGIRVEGYFTKDNELMAGQFKTLMNGEEEVFRIYKPDGMYKVVHEGAYKDGHYRPYARTIFIDNI